MRSWHDIVICCLSGNMASPIRLKTADQHPRSGSPSAEKLVEKKTHQTSLCRVDFGDIIYHTLTHTECKKGNNVPYNVLSVQLLLYLCESDSYQLHHLNVHKPRLFEWSKEKKTHISIKFFAQNVHVTRRTHINVTEDRVTELTPFVCAVWPLWMLLLFPLCASAVWDSSCDPKRRQWQRRCRATIG